MSNGEQSYASAQLHNDLITPELSNEIKRDMSRADWQRGLGALLMSQSGDLLFADGQIRVGSNIDASSPKAKWLESIGLSVSRYRARTMLDNILDNRAIQVGINLHDRFLMEYTKQGLEEHTYYGGVEGLKAILQEACQAQVHFTCNLLDIIAESARKQKVKHHTSETPADMAVYMRRPDVRDIINTALFTANGVWQAFTQGGIFHWSNLNGPDAPDTLIGTYLFESIDFQDDTIKLKDDFKHYLQARLQKVNKAGDNRPANLAYRPSSGCPARHTRVAKRSDAVFLKAAKELTQLFDVSLDELFAPRQQNTVEQGLDFMAGILDNFDAYATGRAFTYASSAQ